MAVEIKTTAGLLVAEGAKLLESGGSPRLDAEILLAFSLGLRREAIITNPDMEVGGESAEKYRSLIERRATREPVAYITGRKEFYKESFAVDRSVLIPRPETEGIVEEVLCRFRDPKALTLLDIGTGSGCIALSIALERPGWRVTGVDTSSDALSVAVKNGQRLGAGNVDFFESDLFASVDASVNGKYDIVVSNPPYIDIDLCADLPPDVREFEPHGALLAGNKGLSVIESILREAPDHMNRDGVLYCEIGYGQKERVQDILNAVPGKPWGAVEFIEDLAGHPRIFVVGLKEDELKVAGL
jgi:release factor glutamine methyltransferase